MELCVLGSGSKGQCVYVESGDARVLFDAGFTGKEIRRRLHAIGVDASTITAIVVSHEHSDHVTGLRSLARHYPVFATAGTFSVLGGRYVMNGTEVIRAGEWREVGSLRFIPVPTSHDAAEPVGFVIEDGDCRAAIITDLGVVTKLVQHRLEGLTVAVIESNHDPDMLMNGPYPWDLKKRIKGRHGHLANPEAGELMASIRHAGLKHVLAAHLSETNNRPELAMQAAREALDGNTRVHVCAQNRPTPVIKIG